MKLSLEDKIAMVKLYEAGYSYGEIAKKFNVSIPVTNRIIHVKQVLLHGYINMKN